MKINFNDIPKFVINLDRRQDRLEEVTKEFNWMGWTFERFSAIDTNSYEGCGFSHKKLSELILERGYEFAMVFEDDVFFMPYSKNEIKNIEEQLNLVEWDVFNFAPSIHRPLSKFSNELIDLTNQPPKDESKHRGIFGTSGFILTKKACEMIIKWDTNEIIENSHRQIPIDEFFDKAIYPNIKSLCYKLPILTQRKGFSDINKTEDNNHYLMTYNWNVYMPFEVDKKYFDFNYTLNEKNYHEN